MKIVGWILVPYSTLNRSEGSRCALSHYLPWLNYVYSFNPCGKDRFNSSKISSSLSVIRIQSSSVSWLYLREKQKHHVIGVRRVTDPIKWSIPWMRRRGILSWTVNIVAIVLLTPLSSDRSNSPHYGRRNHRGAVHWQLTSWYSWSMTNLLWM